MFAAKLREHAVFSAYAEVVPSVFNIGSVWYGILRVRGGSSFLPRLLNRVVGYSPRTRR